MACVLTPISVNGGPVSGSLSVGCSSTHRAAYAKYFTFTVVQGAENVVIQMTGLGFLDTYLYLLEGTGFTGTVLYEDDDSGPGFQALIQIPYLPPGSYTLEATSFSMGKVGAFTLEIAGVVIPPVVHPPVEIFEHLHLTEQQKAFYPNVHAFSETLTITEGVAGVRGAPPVILPESLSVLDTVETEGGTFLVPLSESLSISELGDATMVGEVMPLESLAISEAVVAEDVVVIGETLTVTEARSTSAGLHAALTDSLGIVEVVDLAAIFVETLDDTTLRVTFPAEIRLQDAVDVLRYRLQPVNGGVPIRIDRVLSIQRAKAKGVEGTIDVTPPATSTPGVNIGEALTIYESVAVEHQRDRVFYGDFVPPPPRPLFSHDLLLRDMPPGISEEGDYVHFEDAAYNPDVPTRVERVGVFPGTHVQVDLPFYTTDPRNGQLTWVLQGAVVAVVLVISKPTNGKIYELVGQGLRKKQVGVLDFHTQFVAVSSLPKVESVAYEPEEGSVVVRYNVPMRADRALTDPLEYSIAGPSTVQIQFVRMLDDRSVLLKTIGFGAGSYQVFVNATGTPKDIAGNPIDPSYNAAIFTTSVPTATRSIFVDRGPITKPPLTIATGTGLTVVDATTLTLTGSVSPSVVGLYIILGANATNGGTYLITAWVSPTQIRVRASLHTPDVLQATTTWEVYDPRNGEIADDPSDVSVRVNSVPVTPLAVIGLLGQVVLPSPPAPADDVKVDYSFICNPTVEVRRLNSKEFRLNAWNRDQGYGRDAAAHHYRYNNVLITPSNYTPADMQATLAQPRQRDLKYRAYERAYSALLNDPNLLLLNSPLHHIAYPPLSRTVESSFINYQPTALPEAYPSAPWTRLGTGTASLVFNRLVVGDTTTGPFPVGEPLYWTRTIDLTFPHVYAATWQFQIDAVTTFEGVWTGLAAGFSDELKAIVVGYLLVGGVRKFGILRRGAGNDPSQVVAWAGGLDSLGNPTGLPSDLDWSTLHSFRIYQSGGVVRVFIDGEIVESLRLLEDDLPYLEELNDPFNQAQNSFFGSLSRPAVNQSTWDFVRYLILPTNPLQTAPSIFVSYEGNDFPETARPPWTPVGYHGTESIVASSSLQVDSTSATDAATEAAVGYMGGDFRGFARLEPLLAVSADVILDVNVTLLTHTHGIAPNAVMAAIDDGTRLLQLSFFPDQAAPKFSYGGRSLPEDFQPTPWTPSGGASASMVGRTLWITDASTLDGRIYYRDDTAGIGATNRIVAASTDYILEFRCLVQSHTPDPGGFSGVTGDIWDGSRVLGLLLLDIGGVRYVAPHSDGTLLPGPVLYAFEWDDGEAHTYRLVKSGTNVTVLVDGAFLGIIPYAAFAGVVGPTTGTISWGSSTASSTGARSVVGWEYANVWRVLSGLRHYVGFWKGTDPNSLTGYHLPLKFSGRGAVVIGNTLQDTVANFVSAGLVAGDQLIVDSGSNKGTYEIVSVAPTVLTFAAVWPVQPSVVTYRVPLQVDWTTPHKYRLSRSPDGSTVLMLDSQPTALITIGYNEMDLPPSAVGVPVIISGGLPSITWGAFDPTNLSSTLWDFVRYGITRAPTEMRIVPHHENLNQRNVMASPDHLRTTIPHSHTDFWSSDIGIPPQTEPDFLKNPLLIAYTLLNEGTPLVPSTQSTEVQVPTPTVEFVSALNRPEDLLNIDGDFKLNDGALRHILKVPNDVLYTSLSVLETTTGDVDLVTPFCDSCETPDWGTFYWTKETCLTYDGAVLPENSGSATPWTRRDDVPADVFATPFSGVLTYGTTGPTRTVYRNPTSLPDSVSLTTEVTIRMRVLQDATFGLGDSQVRLGFSSSAGFTLSLAFVTTPLGERYVLIVDQNTLAVLGGIPFNWYDGLFHVYRMVRDPSTSSVLVFVDS